MRNYSYGQLGDIKQSVTIKGLIDALPRLKILDMDNCHDDGKCEDDNPLLLLETARNNLIEMYVTCHCLNKNHKQLLNERYALFHLFNKV